MDEPHLRIVRTTNEPSDDETPKDQAPKDEVNVAPEENPWATAPRGEGTGHPSLQRPIPDRAQGRTSGTDRRMRAYLHLVEGP